MARYPKQDDPGGKNVLPSVTEIVGDCTDKSDALTQWAANMVVKYIREKDIGGSETVLCVKDEDLEKARFHFKTVSQKALDIGSEVHDHIDRYLKNGDESYMDLEGEAFNAFTAFLQWSEEHNLKPISLEQTVYGDVDGYCWAGTMDIECYLNDKRTVIDFKTSKDFYWDSMGPQIAAYKSLTDATHCGVLRLDKESGMPFYRDRTKYYDRDLRIFKNMVRIYMDRHPVIAKGCYNG